MEIVLWIVFLGSFSALTLITIKNRYSLQWLTKVGAHIVVAAVALYMINWVGAAYDFHLPINGNTIGVIGILGLPGLLMLTAVKWIVL